MGLSKSNKPNAKWETLNRDKVLPFHKVSQSLKNKTRTLIR